MSHTVSKMILFTLTACPTGRNMGTILREVSEQYPSIEFQTVYVEIDVETTNHFKIKTNPTLLLLDNKAQELYRLEGFHETEEIHQIINSINENRLRTTTHIEPNKSTVEDYEIFLLKNGKPSSIKVQYHNETSIKAPRITIINLLLMAEREGYENPFPKDAMLEKVEFNDSWAKITIKSQNSNSSGNLKHMEILLLKTLESFGIKEITLFFP